MCCCCCCCCGPLCCDLFRGTHAHAHVMPHAPRCPRPSASPVPVWHTLALLFFCLVTSALTHEEHPSLPRQTFLEEGVDTRPEDVLLEAGGGGGGGGGGGVGVAATEHSVVVTKALKKGKQSPGRRLDLHHTAGSGPKMNATTSLRRLAENDLNKLGTRTLHQPTAYEDSPAPGELEHQSHRTRRGALHGPLWTDKRTLFVELVVVADWRMWRKYGSVSGVHTRVRKVLSVANALLNRLGVVVVLTEVKVWNDGDKFRVTDQLFDNLQKMKTYREELLKNEPHLPNDNTVFLTRIEMPGTQIAKAYTKGMCQGPMSVSVVQDAHEREEVVGDILAHEMGHNLGMKHDEDAADALGHPCRCDTGICIMRRSASTELQPDIEWSSCSREYFDKMRRTTALDCLKNVPTKLLPGSSCGDGVVDLEAGEQCDCGPPEYCDNSCCVADTCRLAANASCASGACCDTQRCQPREVGYVCRAPLHDCDLPEYCSGYTEYCPPDVSKMDGAPCSEGKGHCYQGECGSHEGRCQYVWGTGATVASPECYSNLNTKGSGDGNCGKHPTGDQYLRCTPQSTSCGTLHCLPPPVQETRFHDHHFNRTEQVEDHSCSFIVSSAYYPMEDWLSPDGASCGQDKMCVKQRCVEVPAPDGDCLGGCSGRGVCNSRGHCHCDAGFAPPDCSRRGLGGSIDSQGMGGVADNSQTITAVWVLLVTLLALLVVVCCCWGYLRSWWQRRGRDCISPVIPCCATCLDSCCCPVVSKATQWIITVGSSRQEKRNIQKEIRSVAPEGEDEAMLCSVDVGIKQDPQTNTWGVADEKLVTDVITYTPKNSPDFRRKVRLPSNSPILHHKSTEILERPKYFQSMSVDSGCVSNEEDGVSSSRSSIHMSMKSLISTLRKFGSTSPRNSPEKDIQRSKTLGSQRSMPLSRFVVDPLAGNRSSRQGTPPPDHMRPAFRRSVTVDASSSARVRRSDVPQPPPANLKPHKSEDNLQNVSKVANNRFVMAEKGRNSSNSGSNESRISGVNSYDPRDGSPNQSTKKPMKPFHKSLSPLKVSPPRDTPPPPPLRETRGSNGSGPWKTKNVSQHSNTASNRQSLGTNGKPAKSLKANIHTRGGPVEMGPAKTSALTRETSKKNVKDIAQIFEAK